MALWEKRVRYQVNIVQIVHNAVTRESPGPCHSPPYPLQADSSTSNKTQWKSEAIFAGSHLLHYAGP